MVTGLVTIAGGIGLMMAVGNGAVMALKWFNSYDIDFNSKKKRDDGYTPGYNRDRDDSYRNKMNGMKRNSPTNIK